MTRAEERRIARRASESLLARIVFELERIESADTPIEYREGVRAALHVVRRIGREAS